MDVMGKFENAKKVMEEIENSQLILETRKQHIKLAPKFIGNFRGGVHQQLSALILHPDKVLDGFPLAYNNIRVLQKAGKTISDQTCVHFDIEADFIMFKPAVGCKLYGKVNKIAKRHIGCLVHDHFNAWIPHTSSTEKVAADRLMGAEVEFAVQDISINRNVLSIKGKFEKFLSPNLQKNNIIFMDPSAEKPITPRKKKKAANTTIVDNDTIAEANTEEVEGNDIVTTKKKKKHQKQVTEISQAGSVDSQIGSEPYETANNEVVEEPPRKVKKKHKKDKRKSMEANETVVSGAGNINDSIASVTSSEPLFTSTQTDDVNNSIEKMEKKHKKDKRKSMEANETLVSGAGNINDSIASVTSSEPLFTSTQTDDVNNRMEKIDKKHKKKKKSKEKAKTDESEVSYKNSFENGSDDTTGAREDLSEELVHDSASVHATAKSRKRRHGDNNEFTKLKESAPVSDLDLSVPSPFKKLKRPKKLVVDLDFDSSADFEESSKIGKKEKKKKKQR